MKLSYTFITVVLLSIASSCNPKYALKQGYDIQNEAWTYADSLRFEFEIADTITLYDLLLEVKHTTAFGAQNLYTRISTQFPDGTRLSKPVSLEFANAIGEWQGKCNTKSCTVEIPIQEDAYFNQAGKYAVILEQFMRDSVVNGVQRITLNVIETGKVRNN